MATFRIHLCGLVNSIDFQNKNVLTRTKVISDKHHWYRTLQQVLLRH